MPWEQETDLKEKLSFIEKKGTEASRPKCNVKRISTCICIYLKKFSWLYLKYIYFRIGAISVDNSFSITFGILAGPEALLFSSLLIAYTLHPC